MDIKKIIENEIKECSDTESKKSSTVLCARVNALKWVLAQVDAAQHRVDRTPESGRNLPADDVVVEGSEPA